MFAGRDGVPRSARELAMRIDRGDGALKTPLPELMRCLASCGDCNGGIAFDVLLFLDSEPGIGSGNFCMVM